MLGTAAYPLNFMTSVEETMTNIPKHVMIDLETMNTTVDCKIVAIGAVVFDPRFNVVTDNTFFLCLDWKAQTNRTSSRSTKDWWKKQSGKAKLQLLGENLLEDALWDLKRWLPEGCKVWGNGSSFDISILEHAYLSCSQEIPWPHYAPMDMRTIKELYQWLRGELNGMGGGGHIAVKDAIYQAEEVNRMWNALGLK